MKKIVGCLAVGLQAWGSAAFAGPVMDLTVASDMAAVELKQLHEQRGSQWSLGLARNEDANATTGFLSFNAVGRLANVDNVRVGVGWKAMYHNTFQSVFSLAVGGSIRFEPTAGVGLETRGYIAPNVLNTNDAERYRELVIRATYDLHARATVFGGWQNTVLEFETGAPTVEIEMADGLMAGFILAF